MPRLAAHRCGPRLFIERGDCAGLAFGGSKPRHDGFPLGEAFAQGAAAVVSVSRAGLAQIDFTEGGRYLPSSGRRWPPTQK